MEKIKALNPAYTKVASVNTWSKVFGRSLKRSEKAFNIKVANNQSVWLCDVSQTTGRPMPVIYQNLSGEVEQYQSVLNCLTAFSPQSISNIILAVCQQQIIFALVREIVRQNLTSETAVEAVSYMVCRHLNFDTDMFTFGYLLELMNYDVS